MLATILATVALAPTLSVSGHTLNWTAVGNGRYKVQAQAQGAHPSNVEVEGTSYTPPEQPGLTVEYHVKAHGENEWSNGVSISYTSEQPQEEPPKEKRKEEKEKEKAPPPPTMLTGLDAGTELADVAGASTLHAKLVRLTASSKEVGASWLLEWTKRYFEHGVTVQPLVTFDGTMLTPAEVKSLVVLDQLPGVKNVELGNETSFSYQYGDNYASASYKERARVYAVRVKEAAEVLNPHGIGVLAQADDGGSGSSNWVKEMFASVPNLTRYVAGWTIHPYPGQKKASQPDSYGVPKMERMVNDLAEEGDTTTPLDVTEWGVSSANGLTLNVGTSITYSEAGQIAETTIPKLIAAAKHHPIATFLVYQMRDRGEPGSTTDHEYFFGALNHKGGSKGAYTTAIAKLMAE
jgi:hypothetical protein